MKKAILIPNPIKDAGLEVTKKVIEKLTEINTVSCIEDKYSSINVPGACYYKTAPSDADVIIVIGGDGSVIDASGLAVELDIPLVGINLGKVGYLTQLEPDSLDTLDRLATGDYRVEEKMLLSVEKLSGRYAEECTHLAVNDVVVSHEDYFGISDIMIENEHGDHVSYRADGVIASTPAGSTAYSLSAGGPIISHTLDSITITPICPHSFFNRAIVYGAGERIRISNSGETVLNVSVDGRYFTKIAKGESCSVYKSDKRFKTITFTESNVFTVLSKKINHLNEFI